MRVTFFRVAERKSPKKGRPRCLRPLRFAPGQPAVLVHGARCGTRCAPAALRSNSRSESVHEACVLRHTPPHALRSSAHTEGMGKRASIRAIASLGPISRVQCLTQPTAASTGRGPAGSSAAMTRMAVRLFGCSAVRLFGCSAVRLFGCSAVRHPTPSGCACAGAVAGWHARRSARASSTDSRWLAARPPPPKASTTAPPPPPTVQVCPFAPRRGRRLRVAFSLVTFFWRSKRKLLARRATPGSRPQHRHSVATTNKA